MSKVPSGKTGKIEDGVVQLRFADDDGTVRDINAAEMAEVLQGFVAFTSDMAKNGLFGDAVPPQVRVRPPKEGSFIIEAVIQWAAENPEVVDGLQTAAASGVTQALNVAFKRLRNVPQDFEHLENGNTKVIWKDGQAQELPRAVWNRLNAMKRPTRGQLKKISIPLGDEADRLEIRDADIADTTEETLATAPDAVAVKADYREAAHEEDEVSEKVETFAVEATLDSVDFRPDGQWRVRTSRGNRLASMDDERFSKSLDDGVPLHKNDIFEVKIRETRTTKNGSTTTKWSLVEVQRKKRGGDGDDASSSGSEGAEA